MSQSHGMDRQNHRNNDDKLFFGNGMDVCENLLSSSMISVFHFKLFDYRNSGKKRFGL